MFLIIHPHFALGLGLVVFLIVMVGYKMVSNSYNSSARELNELTKQQVDIYRDNSDGTVTDLRTNLEWIRCSIGQELKGNTCDGEIKKYNWQGALDAAIALNRQGGYAGYLDWRVPTKKELQTLIYCTSGQPETLE